MLFDKPREPFASFTGFLLAWAGQRSMKNFAAALQPVGLDPRQYTVLFLVADEPGLTQQELAQRSSVDPSSMVAIMDDLEARGLAERRPHPGDRRKRAVHLTADGRRALERAVGAIAEGQMRLQEPLDAEERETLRTLLRKLAGLEGPPAVEWRGPPERSG
jgi:DNA-binding MarR family transcriptional regulator